MKYFTAKEARGEDKLTLKAHYRGYEGRNLRGGFAANLVQKAAQSYLDLPIDKIKLLDYGIASGLFFHQLSELGFKNFYGLDMDDYLDAENRSLVKELKIADCNSERLPWLDNSFDIITAWCFFPHLENPHHCIRETLRILKPGGLFILSIPHLLSRASIQYFLKHGDFARYHPEKNHITAFTPGIFQSTILKYFETIRMDYLIDERSFTGIKGTIRKFILQSTKNIPALHHYFEKRWGYNQIWVLKKR